MKLAATQMQKMKTTYYSLISLMSCLPLWTTPVAKAANMETMSKLDLLAIKKVHIGQTNSEYYLEVELTFENRNADPVKLRNGSFATVLESKEKRQKPEAKSDAKPKSSEEELEDIRIDIGHAAIDQLEIPGAAGEKTAGTAGKLISIKLGPSQTSTTDKMVRLWNVLGDPSAPMTLVLTGTAEVGLKLPRGWVFEKDKAYDLELRFAPAVKRTVLMQ